MKRPFLAILLTAMVALGATALLTRHVVIRRAGVRRNPELVVSLASWAWVLLAVYWLV